jgi:hypothetical protein
MEELPCSWRIGSGRPALPHELTLHNRAEFFWEDGRIEIYSEPELKQKIESEGRGGSDPFVLAYNRLRELALSDSVRFPPPPTLSKGHDSPEG